MSRVIPLHPAGRVAIGAAPMQPEFRTPPPLSIYIHYPWCVKKCPYCDFNSHAVRGEPPERDYLDALVADLEASLPSIWGRRVHSVFIGGGTPSLLSAAGMERLLTDLRTRVQLAPDAEITVEANPGTVEAAHFDGYRAAGVTRISLGIQSFDDAKLAALGRIHSADEARRAIDAALQHFDEVNLDLMYALPGQTPEQALADLDTALGFATPHLSCYHLTLEPNTPFAAHPPALPDDDLAAAMQDAIEQRLGAAGYDHYETSAFARPGHRCRHNLNYWQFGDYLGIGAGAHGKLSFHDRVLRHMRHKHPSAYLEGAAHGRFVQEEREVAALELPFEFMMNALRLNGGFALALFEERTGLPLTAVHGTLLDAARRGLLSLDAGHVVPTLQGRRFLNELLQMFLPEP